jgi:hypothetical protein
MDRVNVKTMKFKSFQNVVQLDESWFYVMENGRLIRTFPGDELPPPLKAQHKSHIPKVMFLTAIALPRPEYEFNGNIGIWRVCESVEATKKARTITGETYSKRIAP